MQAENMGLFSKFFGPPSRNAFARKLLKRFRRAGVTDLAYNSAEFSLNSTTVGTWYLSNAYAEYCRCNKTRREEVIESVLQGWASQRHGIPKDFEDVRSDLLPVLQARSYYEVDVARLGATFPVTLPYEIIAESLCVAPAYDLPRSRASINDEVLKEWDITLYEALEIAMQNLRERTTGYAQVGSIYTMVHGDSYDATRLLLTDWVRSLELKGEPVAMVPNRDTLLVTGADDEEGLGGMLRIAAEAIDHERYISGIPVKLVDDTWEPWHPPSDHKHIEEFDKLRVQSCGREYENQKVLLEEENVRANRDVFVASFAAVRDEKSGRIFSFCTWSCGIPSWLPKTDLIYFGRVLTNGEVELIGRCTWQAAEKVVGHLMQPLSYYPGRVFVNSFPSIGELELLIADAG